MQGVASGGLLQVFVRFPKLTGALGLGMYPLCLWLMRHYEKKGLL